MWVWPDGGLKEDHLNQWAWSTYVTLCALGFPVCTLLYWTALAVSGHILVEVFTLVIFVDFVNVIRLYILKMPALNLWWSRRRTSYVVKRMLLAALLLSLFTRANCEELVSTDHTDWAENVSRVLASLGPFLTYLSIVWFVYRVSCAVDAITVNLLDIPVYVRSVANEYVRVSGVISAEYGALKTKCATGLVFALNEYNLMRQRALDYFDFMRWVSWGGIALSFVLPAFWFFRGGQVTAYPQSNEWRSTTNRFSSFLTGLLSFLMLLLAPIYGAKKMVFWIKPMLELLRSTAYATWFVQWFVNWMYGEQSFDDLPRTEQDLRKATENFYHIPRSAYDYSNIHPVVAKAMEEVLVESSEDSSYDSSGGTTFSGSTSSSSSSDDSLDKGKGHSDNEPPVNVERLESELRSTVKLDPYGDAIYAFADHFGISPEDAYQFIVKNNFNKKLAFVASLSGDSDPRRLVFPQEVFDYAYEHKVTYVEAFIEICNSTVFQVLEQMVGLGLIYDGHKGGLRSAAERASNKYGPSKPFNKAKPEAPSSYFVASSTGPLPGDRDVRRKKDKKDRHERKRGKSNKKKVAKPQVSGEEMTPEEYAEFIRETATRWEEFKQWQEARRAYHEQQQRESYKRTPSENHYRWRPAQEYYARKLQEAADCNPGTTTLCVLWEELKRFAREHPYQTAAISGAIIANILNFVYVAYTKEDDDHESFTEKVLNVAPGQSRGARRRRRAARRKYTPSGSAEEDGEYDAYAHDEDYRQRPKKYRAYKQSVVDVSTLSDAQLERRVAEAKRRTYSSSERQADLLEKLALEKFANATATPQALNYSHLSSGVFKFMKNDKYMCSATVVGGYAYVVLHAIGERDDKYVITNHAGHYTLPGPRLQIVNKEMARFPIGAASPFKKRHLRCLTKPEIVTVLGFGTGQDEQPDALIGFAAPSGWCNADTRYGDCSAPVLDRDGHIVGFWTHGNGKGFGRFEPVTAEFIESIGQEHISQVGMDFQSRPLSPQF